MLSALDVEGGERFIPRAIETVAVGPALERLLAVQQEYLHTLVLHVEVVGVGRRPFLRQRRIDAARYMQNHGAWGRAVGRPNEASRRVLAVVVGHESQSRDVALGATGRIACRNDVHERDFLALAHRCRRRRVVHFQPPFRQLRLEEV